mgnify:CR=1 FL=1
MEIDISGAVQGFVQDIEKQVASRAERAAHVIRKHELSVLSNNCLLYTSPSPRDCS